MTIKLNNVSKRFGRTQALDCVSLEFGGNKIYGLLGLNGAGKSTLLNIITSRLAADSGEVIVNGEPVRDNDNSLNQLYMLSEQNYYPESMRVKEAIRWAASFYENFDKEAALNLAERFQLNLNKKIITLSTGYQSIFKIVIALSTNAPFLLLDEPVLGLDAQHRDMFYKILIERYSENPCTIIIATHLIAEAAGLIEHCMIIKNGRIIKDDTCEGLLRDGYSISGPAAILDDYLRDKEVLSTSSLGGLKTAYLNKSTLAQTDLPQGLEIGKLNLQEYFIQLMNDTSIEEGTK